MTDCWIIFISLWSSFRNGSLKKLRVIPGMRCPFNVALYKQQLNHQQTGSSNGKSACCSGFTEQWFLLTSVQIRCHYWADKLGPSLQRGGTDLDGMSKQYNNGFYCCVGSNFPTSHWHGAQLSVEQPGCPYTLNVADCELKGALTEKRLYFPSHFLAGRGSIWVRSKDEGTGNW